MNSATTTSTTQMSRGPVDGVRNEKERSQSPTLSGSFGGDRKALFSRVSTGSPMSPTVVEDSQQGLGAARQKTRSRSKSFSEESQKVFKFLAFPVNVPLIIYCILWYWSSAMSNTLNKSILTSFPYPVTLSLVQFILSVAFGAATMVLVKRSRAVAAHVPKGFYNGSFRFPTRELILTTAPMGGFQLSGHILSHMATSRIPVSLVHTIKALSPLLTVAAYRILFKIKYPLKTYYSLIPLTTGVVLTCSTDFRTQGFGLFFAFLAAMIFVMQNMFSKKLLTPSTENKLDKLNLICYCSTLAFLFSSPLWFFGEGITIAKDYTYSRGRFFNVDERSAHAYGGTQLLFRFLLNGFTHFFQNIMAFQVLGMVTPVTYSVASLLKRIVVITSSIVWFGQTIDGVQKFGIILTFMGLYLYDRLGGDKKQNYNHSSSIMGGTLPK